jgi:N-hydroxyarylamine O-acetyltransferase
MSKFIFDADSYLTRIGVTQPVAPDTKTLDIITRAQGYAIPFENFDIQLGRGISLSPGDIYQKLVLSPRGGYCFELNNLLLMALRHFGFEARPLLARVHLRGTATGRTHQLLLVKINNEEWLADVGFGGGGLLAPIPFVLEEIFTQDGLQFRLLKSELFDYMLQLRKDDAWINLYSFDFTHVTDADIQLGNHFTSTSSESFFTFSRVATRPVPGGRISLMNFTLKKTLRGKEEICELTDDQVYLEALKEHFDIRLDAPYSALKPVKSP